MTISNNDAFTTGSPDVNTVKVAVVATSTFSADFATRNRFTTAGSTTNTFTANL
jgi:hypothetical protein